LIDFLAENAPALDMYKVQGLINDFNNAVYQYGYNHAKEYYSPHFDETEYERNSEGI